MYDVRLNQNKTRLLVSDSLGVYDVVELLQEVGVHVVVLTSQSVEVHHHVLLHRDVVQHVDEI